MRKNRRDNKAKYLLILLLLIAVGYAAIATTLKINGSAEIKSAKWDVYWENPQVLSGSVTETKPTLSESDTKATFDVTLNEPGDYYEFTIDAVNNGTLDAKIDTNGIIKQVKNASGEVVNPTILKYEVTNNDQGHTALEEGHILAKKSGNTPTKETYRVRVEYRNDNEINPSDLDDNDLVFTIEFSVKYVQGPKAEPEPSAISYVTRQNEGQITPGDVVKIGDTENFYVLSSDNNKTTLLAKYNLLVGNITEGWDIVGQVQPTDDGYCLQNVNAVGAYASDTISSGNVAFAARPDGDYGGYWEEFDENGVALEIISPYNANGASYDGNPYPFVYNSSLTTAPDFENDGFNTSGYSIAYYVELYKSKLIEMGATSIITGRLLSFEEADDYKTITDNGVSIIFDNHQGYWLGSAFGPITEQVWHIYNTNTDFYYNDYDYENFFGVRPVIEIPTSELQ